MRWSRLNALVLMSSLGLGCVVLPPAQPEADVKHVALDQGLSDTERRVYQHQSQGSALLPYEWFVALEQPQIKFVGTVGLFRDPDYLSRFGLLPSLVSMGDNAPALRPNHCEPKVGPALKPSDADYYCGLPAGMSRATVTDPGTGKKEDVIGFTCAACHSGEIRNRGTAIRIVGASNSFDVTQYQTALVFSLALNQRVPFRFNRFANRVLKARGLDANSPDYTAQRDTLRRDFDAFMTSKEQGPATATEWRKYLYLGHPGGFGRTDALARIGNWIFGTELENEDNLVVGSAPVKFPSIWDAPYYSWAQYNGSVEQAMVRNLGEVLGVRARLAFNPGGKFWGQSGEREAVITSTADIPGLYSLEMMLRGAGDDYFNGLRSPVWPEAYFGKIAWDRVARGQQLYQSRCQHCHLPPLTELLEVVDRPGGKGLAPRSGAGGSKPYWISNNDPALLSPLSTKPFERTEYFLDLHPVEIGSIRTDPGQAVNFAKRVVDTGDTLLPAFLEYNNQPSRYPVRVAPMGTALQMVTIALTTQFYDRVDAQTPAQREEFIQGLPANMREPEAFRWLFTKDGKINRDEWNGYRVPGAVANIGYRPHPLNGIWASPPYLHNGSVPNLYELLSPYEERSKVFYTGNREYDLDRIGYQSQRFRGGFRYDTSVTGNSNYGHLFQDGGPGNGIIGPFLTPDDRRAIIEFLKTLCPPGTQTDLNAPGAPALCQPLPGLTRGR
jgi:RoxA-like, cytochrome c-like